MATIDDLYAALKDEFDLDLVLGGAVEVLVSQWRAQAMTQLVNVFPFLGWAVVNPVLGFLVGSGIRFMLNYTEMGAYFWFVDKITKEEVDDFIKARIKHEEALKKGDPDEIKKAEQAAIDKARKLIKFNGLFSGFNISK